MLAFGNISFVGDLLLSVIFAIIYAMLFYVHGILGFILHNRISGDSL